VEYPQVIRIFATSQFPDYDSPWQAQPPVGGTGSGVVIGKNLVLTGAHVVCNATFIQVQKAEDPDKVVAQVKAICHDVDLALLEVEDPDFTKGMKPAGIGGLPDLRDEVQVVGFPVGGDEISITEGVVSRIEVQRYSHSQRSFLAATVDAAINEGNSGGPVFFEGAVAGIAFQKNTGAENQGELVPGPLIKHFLDRVAAGEERIEMPALGLETQNLEAKRLREELGLTKGQSGLFVNAVTWGGSSHGLLQPRDAILSIDGQRIANNGTLRYGGRYRTLFNVVLGERSVGDKLELGLLREGKKKKVTLELKPLRRLAPHSQYEVAPGYLVWGGLVMQPLSRDFLDTWDEWWDEAPKELSDLYYNGNRSEDRQQVVVLTRVLADDITVGYGFADFEVIDRVNGEKVRDLKHLAELLDGAKGKVEVLTTRKSLLVYDADEARAAQQRILERYRIPNDRSHDLRSD
jgi:S1-C subfamily serine protease